MRTALLILLATVLVLFVPTQHTAPTAQATAPVVVMGHAPAAPLPATEHCWVEHKPAADGGDEMVSGDPAQAAPGSTPVTCPNP